MPVLSAEGNVELPLLLTKLSLRSAKKMSRLPCRSWGLPIVQAQAKGLSVVRNSVSRCARAGVPTHGCSSATSRPGIWIANGRQILGLLQVLNAEHGKTIVIVTHDQGAGSPGAPALEKGSVTRASR